MNAKLVAAAAVLLVTHLVHAQQGGAPARLEPLPEAPPPPRMAIDPALEPQITIRQRGNDKIEEFRVNGRLYMVRVTPPGGTPYVLIDHKGDGQFSQPSHGPADAHNLSVPMWVIRSF
ncbi:MAG: DUF2782 domain-containing protein [Burkholderiales bacterium]|nr:DUF2782 domain-containing protein [Burkholderiales bacterium]